MIVCDKILCQYVEDLAELASNSADVYPVDRKFLLGHMQEIVAFNPREFVLCNLSTQPELYTTQLFVCLPEVWNELTHDDILEIAESITGTMPYFSLIKFVYKFLEIDIIEQVLATRRVSSSKALQDSIMDYVHSQGGSFIKSELDFESFHDGFIEVDIDNWKQIKQKLLLDPRVKPATTTDEETANYLGSVVVRFVIKD